MHKSISPHDRWKEGQANSYWSLSWGSLDVLLSGRSAIDMSTLSFYDFNDATHFLESYGFQLTEKEDAKQAHAILIESIFFIKNTLIPSEWEQGCCPPQEVLLCEDPRKLLLWASSHSSLLQEHRLWSCAILRVMHTIAHLDRLELNHEHEYARKQIQQKFGLYCNNDQDGDTWFGSELQKVPLKSLEWKQRKSRHSILLKLIHKPSNVSETIYDHLGIRMTTHFLSDAFIVLKILLEHNLVTFASTNPTRARNTLVDIASFKKNLEKTLSRHAKHEICDKELLEEVSLFSNQIDDIKVENPHSSNSYQSIQITCRQRISYPNPALSWMKKIEENSPTPPWFDYVKSWYGVHQKRDLHVFYPFEIQIQDSQAAAESSSVGAASHENYKQAQVETARKRVAGGLLENFKERFDLQNE